MTVETTSVLYARDTKKHIWELATAVVGHSEKNGKKHKTDKGGKTWTKRIKKYKN